MPWAHPCHGMQAMARHKRSHEKFLKLANRIAVADPPCMSSAEDWESQNSWVDEMVPPSEPDSNLPSLPDGACELHHSAHALSAALPQRPGRWLEHYFSSCCMFVCRNCCSLMRLRSGPH